MANTVIQLKYSEVTATPSSLNVAEPAYSNTSNKFFIGLGGNQVVAIGGKYYTDAVDAATNANTSSTLVKRGADGGFSTTYVRADLYGNANTATALLNGRNFELSGTDISSGAVAFDGTAGVTLQANLLNTTVSAGTYGGATQIPTFTVDAKGRLTSAANVSISTSLGIAGDTGTDTVALASDTITFVGGDGITTEVYSANSNVKIDVDATVMRTTGGQTISGDVSITGNLIVSGNTTQINVAQLLVSDPLIYLGENNYASDIVDIGFVGNYYDGTTQRHAGFVRKFGSNTFYAFSEYTPEPNTTNIINTSDASFRVADLVANITGANVSGLITDIAVSDGGTGASSFAAGQLIVGDGTNALQSLANTGTAGTYGAQDYVPVLTTDAWGRVSSVSNTQIGIDASRVLSGTLGIGHGGTGSSSFTTKGVIVSDTSSTTGALTALTSSTEGHVLQINASGVPTFAYLNGGSF